MCSSSNCCIRVMQFSNGKRKDVYFCCISGLLKICNDKLNAAEESIAKIVKDNEEIIEFNPE